MRQTTDELDAASVRRFVDTAVDLLGLHRAEIDRLNVFPIADRDTGTNLLTTVGAAATALADATTDDVVKAWDVLATGALLHAAGNSGTILAQVLRAIADATAEAGRLDGAVLSAGFRNAARRARAAVAEPVAGTVLTVLDAVAEELPGEPGVGPASPPMREVAETALTVARRALHRTPDQLPVLAAAGVGDAGGRGLVIVLAALVAALGGNPGPDLGAAGEREPAEAAARSLPVPESIDAVRRLAGPQLAGYEVQYVLTADDGDQVADVLRSELTQLADSVVVASGGAGVLTVHAHTFDVGAVLERGLAHGRASRISVEPLTVSPHGGAPTPSRLSKQPGRRRAVVAVFDGLRGAAAGLVPVLEQEAVRVVAGPAPSSVITDAARECCRETREALLLVQGGAREVVEPAADQLRADGVRVAVVPIRSPLQALAAAAVHDPHRPFDDDMVAMAEAAAGTRVAELETATSEALTSAGRCRPGDVLGLIDGEVVEVGRGTLAVALALADRLLGVGAELMTVVAAADLGPGIAQTLRDHVRQRSPLTEVTVYEVAPGGTTGSPLLLGIE